VSSRTYRERAGRCLRVAERAAEPEIKAVVVRLASAWHDLARREESAANGAEQGESGKSGRGNLGRHAE
jgi:hypothetical protein